MMNLEGNNLKYFRRMRILSDMQQKHRMDNQTSQFSRFLQMIVESLLGEIMDLEDDYV